MFIVGWTIHLVSVWWTLNQSYFVKICSLHISNVQNIISAKLHNGKTGIISYSFQKRIIIKRVWCNCPCKIQMDTNGKCLISQFSYVTGLWIWGENWTLGALGSGEGKSTQCQSNPQSRAVRGGVFGRRARWPAQTSSRPTWWTPSGSAPLPDTATPDTRALVVPAVWETQRDRVKTGEV